MTNLEQSVLILEQALEAANKAGVFTLKDSKLVGAALDIVKQQFGAAEPVETKVEEPQPVAKTKK